MCSHVCSIHGAQGFTPNTKNKSLSWWFLVAFGKTQALKGRTYHTVCKVQKENEYVTSCWPMTEDVRKTQWSLRGGWRAFSERDRPMWQHRSRLWCLWLSPVVTYNLCIRFLLLLTWPGRGSYEKSWIWARLGMRLAGYHMDGCGRIWHPLLTPTLPRPSEMTPLDDTVNVLRDFASPSPR